MKICQCCGALASAEAPHCARCGEASWKAAPALVPDNAPSLVIDLHAPLPALAAEPVPADMSFATPPVVTDAMRAALAHGEMVTVSVGGEVKPIAAPVEPVSVVAESTADVAAVFSAPPAPVPAVIAAPVLTPSAPAHRHRKRHY